MQRSIISVVFIPYLEFSNNSNDDDDDDDDDNDDNSKKNEKKMTEKGGEIKKKLVFYFRRPMAWITKRGCEVNGNRSKIPSHFIRTFEQRFSQRYHKLLLMSQFPSQFFAVLKSFRQTHFQLSLFKFTSWENTHAHIQLEILAIFLEIIGECFKRIEQFEQIRSVDEIWNFEIFWADSQI